MAKLYLLGFVLLYLQSAESRDIEREITIKIGPGTEECFYQDILAEETLDVEYQVIDGGHGDLDINFYVLGPNGNVLFQDYKKADNTHRTTMSEAGDYKICWDNTISRMNSKTVYFSLMIEGTEEGNDEALWGESFDSSYTAEDIYEMKVEDIKDSIDRIRQRLTKSRFVQDQLRAFEARDRNLAEHSFSKVNNLSCLSIAVMIITGVIQVVLLRSLFDEKSRFHKIWKKSSSSPYS